MVDVKRWVVARTRFRGLHHWPNCPIDEVGFLRHLHRHEFHVTVSIEVSGADREVEFFILQRQIDSIIAQRFPKEDESFVVGMRSCEMIADEIHDGLQEEFEDREIKIAVSEDGENEAMCEYAPGIAA